MTTRPTDAQPQTCSAPDCANVWTTHATGGKVAPGNWCSLRCFWRVRARNEKGPNGLAGTTLTCARCGTQFPYQGRGKRSEQCTDCRNGANLRRYYDQRASAGAPVTHRELTCPICASEFTSSQPRARWCSRACKRRDPAYKAKQLGYNRAWLAKTNSNT